MNNRNLWNRKYLEGSVQVKNSLFEYTSRWIWRIINYYAKDDVGKDCIDVGCGNMSFWRYRFLFYRPCEKYIGIDISDIIIKRNKNKFKRRKNRIFIRESSNVYFSDLSSKVVLCMDLLFHIFDEYTYIETLFNLCKYSKKWIILSNWYREPINYNESFQKYRDFKKYQYIFEENGFKLINIYKVPSNDIGAIYVYKRVDENES